MGVICISSIQFSSILITHSLQDLICSFIHSKISKLFRFSQKTTKDKKIGLYYIMIMPLNEVHNNNHTLHLALQQKYFSHSRLLIHCFRSPTHRHGIWTIKGEDELIENHLHQSIYLANQYHVLNYVVIFANLGILSKHLSLKSFY